ncbi:TPA: hypothetical protein ACH3X1_014921 [Trebouxia sp. C0004]
MLPACEARRHYDKLSQTGSVKDYVRELVQVVRELEGTPYHPGGSVFDDFIKGLKSDVHRFAQDHARTGWWTEITDLYQKALDFEVNGLASGRVRDCSPGRTNQPNASRSNDSSERRYAGKKRKGAPGGAGGSPPNKGSGAGGDPGQGSSGGGGGRPRKGGIWISKEEIAARKAHEVCIWCAQEGHMGKDCSNEKTVQLSFVGRS